MKLTAKKRKNDDFPNAEMKLSQGHWTFFGPRLEVKWIGSFAYAQQSNGNVQLTKWCTDSKKLVSLCSKHQCFESWD